MRTKSTRPRRGGGRHSRTAPSSCPPASAVSAAAQYPRRRGRQGVKNLTGISNNGGTLDAKWTWHLDRGVGR